MEFHLASDDGTPIYRQIMSQVQHMIASGRLRPGDQMPSVRALASQLLVNPNTVGRAYKDLEAMGLIEPRQGSGTIVAEGGSPLARSEKRRIIIGRIDALLVEARQLGFSIEEVKSLMDKRDAAMGSKRTA
ncbi:MAG: GntR family transcriptional regulator [Candidatus Hydrogenedentes bacterium]|nr:GntR family transcriptional regulator [Candidatus Hydrogenedentota bacterium]